MSELNDSNESMYCPVCGAEIDPSADACPICGYVLKKPGNDEKQIKNAFDEKNENQNQTASNDKSDEKEETDKKEKSHDKEKKSEMDPQTNGQKNSREEQQKSENKQDSKQVTITISKKMIIFSVVFALIVVFAIGELVFILGSRSEKDKQVVSESSSGSATELQTESEENNDTEAAVKSTSEKTADLQADMEEPDAVAEQSVPESDEVSTTGVTEDVVSSLPAEQAEKIYHLLNADCNLRSQPNASSNLVSSITSTSTKLYYYGENSEGTGSDGQEYIWYKVCTEDGTAGWIRSDLVIPDESPEAVYVLSTKGKNIRIMPTYVSGLLTTINDTSTPLYYYGEYDHGLGSDGQNHDWLKIYINNNQAGWIRSDLVVRK